MEHVSPNPDPIDRPQWRKTSKDQQFPSSLAWCWCLENEMVKLEEQTYKVIIHFRLALTSFKYRSKSGGPVAWAPMYLMRSLWVWVLLSLSLCQCVSESVTARTIDCAPESTVSVCALADSCSTVMKMNTLVTKKQGCHPSWMASWLAWSMDISLTLPQLLVS